MAWISFGALGGGGGKKKEKEKLDSSRLDVVEIARVLDMLPSLFPSWSGYGLISILVTMSLALPPCPCFLVCTVRLTPGCQRCHFLSNIRDTPQIVVRVYLVQSILIIAQRDATQTVYYSASSLSIFWRFADHASQYLTNLMHKICFKISFISCLSGIITPIDVMIPEAV